MKKIRNMFLLLVALMPTVVQAADLEYIACGNAEGIPAPVPQLTSICYTLLIIATPIILIIFSIVALLKAITGGDADAIKKAKNKVVKKFIAAAIVFFVAGIVQFVVSKASTNDSDKNSAVDCINCMLYNEGCAPSTSDNDAYKATGSPSNNASSTQGSSNSETSQSPNADSSDVYTSTKTNIKYNIYNQADSRWADYSYSSSNVKGEGCMITSVAVIASAYDKTITPYEVYKSYPHYHPYTSIPPLTSNAFSCSMVNYPSSDSIKQNLKNGNVVIVKVFGSKKGGSSSFTSSQHYMALIDIDSSGNQIYVGNAYSSSGYGKSGWFSSNEVLKSVQTAEICIPSETLKAKYR